VKTAIVLFNLGGPDGPAAVQPFLFNLFNDAAIIDVPQPLRWLLAKLISSRRAPIARDIYANIGGGSPLLENTQAQASALEAVLAGANGETRCFIAMRYWHPLSDETAQAVKLYAPDRIILLPLYPHYSSTTSGSSLDAWHKAARKARLAVPTRTVCCYPDVPGFIEALTELIRPALAEAGKSGPPRLLFSAHGLPKKIVEAGDPYQWQIERTAASVVERLGRPVLDWLTCYQSRVGPLEWIGPSTEAEIERAGQDGVPLVVVPIAFVSEHSETLVELDIEYRELAERHGVPAYLRVPTVDVAPAFINSLANLVGMVIDAPDASLMSGDGGRLCPASFGKCRCRLPMTTQPAGVL
jgi:protoporphyrin/coproporphyrin ferrochelatase